VLNERRVAGQVFFKNGQTPRDLRRRVSMMVKVFAVFWLFIVVCLYEYFQSSNSRGGYQLRECNLKNVAEIPQQY
jgi:hypothetical protein